MHKIIKQSTVLLIAMSLVSVLPASPGFAQSTYNDTDERSGEKMAFDLVLLRPAGAIGTALGSVFFLISLPFSYAGGNQREAFQSLVKAPAQYTFKRPLGDF